MVSLNDEKKGERLVLITEHPVAEAADLIAHFRASGAPELSAPRRLMRVNELPVLGSGKTDYVAIQRMAEADALSEPPREGRRRK